MASSPESRLAGQAALTAFNAVPYGSDTIKFCLESSVSHRILSVSVERTKLGDRGNINMSKKERNLRNSGNEPEVILPKRSSNDGQTKE